MFLAATLRKAARVTCSHTRYKIIQTICLLIINYTLHNHSSMQQRAGCTVGMTENLTKAGFVLGQIFFSFFGSSDFSEAQRGRRITIIVKPVKCTRKSWLPLLPGIQSDEKRGWGRQRRGEQRDCERMNVVRWGRGPHPACMNSRIIVGIVRRAKSCCVLHHSLFTGGVFLFISNWGSWGSDRCRLCLKKHKHTLSEIHDRNICSPASA